jgi:class 3 adenylate cyclase
MPDEPAPQDTQPLERRLATILCADVAGYSQMMGANEERTVRVFRGHREIFESLVRTHRGRIFNTAGDALLAEFNSAVEAVRCATEIQAALRTRNEHLAAEERMQFRIGINLGDVIIQGGDLLGDGVNVAARIQTATEPGGICISGSVHDQIQNKLSLDFRLLGEQTYKNIAKPVRTYTINEGGVVTTPARRAAWRGPAAIVAAVLVTAGAGTWGYRQYEAQRAEQLRVESQLAAQKLATEQAQRAAEDAKREAQAQLQKQAAEEALRRAQEERNRLAQDRKLLEAERRAAEAAKQQAAEDAQRRAQEERDRAERQRKALQAERLAAESAKKQAASQRAVPVTTAFDGIYAGHLCNHPKGEAKPNCWAVALAVRNGVAEASWLSQSINTSRINGSFAASGALELKLSAWTPQGKPIDGVLLGRVGATSI